MYIPDEFRPCSDTFTAELIDTEVLGCLLSYNENRLITTPLPFLRDDADSEGLTLLSHLAADNTHWEILQQQGEAHLLFMGPHTYVSPQWYSSPVNAPTWNYVLSVLRVKVEIVREHSALLSLMQKTVVHFEKRYAQPSGINLQPERLQRLLGRIIGLKLSVTGVHEKAQLNQNRSLDDQRAVATFLSGSNNDNAQFIAKMMFDNLQGFSNQTSSGG